MAKRIRKPGARRKTAAPKAGPIGCVVAILVALGVAFWALTAVLRP